MSPYSLGSIIVVAGLVLWLLARLLLGIIPRPAARALLPSGADTDTGEPREALLVVQPGGRILTVNPAFRRIFQLEEGKTPSLEWVARRIRPSDAFFTLCMGEGSERLIIEGRFYQVTSYEVDLPTGAVIAIALRPAARGDAGEQPAGSNAQQMQTVAELNKTVAASLDLHATLQAIIESAERLLPVDYLEVCVWDPALAMLTPYRFIGLPGAERTLERLGHHYHAGEGFAGRLARERKPMHMSTVELDNPYATTDPSQAPLHSFLGVPLLVGGELVGTIEAGSITPESLRSEDLDLLALFAEQAAVALHNAVLFQSEQRRAAELSGLAQLTQAISSVQEQRTLIARLVQSIVPLIDVDIIGFLLYNETQRRLESQNPFYGIPAQFLNLYNLGVAPGSAVEYTLLQHAPLVSVNAGEDPAWLENGFAPLANGASLRETALMPLLSGGRMLGYLQASNHTGGERPFSTDELHLLTIIANQAAPMIENAALMQQMRQRALRAEALRKIASLASSAANLDEILHFSLQELAYLLKASLGAAFLLDPEGAVMRLHLPSFYGPGREPGGACLLHSDDPQFPFTVTSDQHPVIYNTISYEQPIIPFYQEWMRQWEIQSVVIVPLVVRDAGIGEVWLGSAEPDYFDLGDMQTVSTAAVQLAGVVEQSYLAMQTDESLRRRVEQLTALMHIARELSSSLDLHSLLRLVYDQALLTTRAGCGSILLLDWNQRDEEQVWVGYSVGDQNRRLLTPLELGVLQSGEPLSIPDLSHSDQEPPHEQVESLLIVPVLYQQKRLGLIELHSPAAHRFDAASVEIAQSLASQAAVALANAIQYEQQTRRSELLKHQQTVLESIFQASSSEDRHSLAFELSQIAPAICEATPFQSVLISVYDPGDEQLHRVTCVGVPEEDWEELRSRPQPWSGVQKLLDERFRVGLTYYIPYDKQPALPDEIFTLNLLPESDYSEEGAWDTNDFLLVPLFDAEGGPLGLISLDAPMDGRRPDLGTFEALEMFGMQTALTILNHQHIQRAQVQLLLLEQSSSLVASELVQLPELREKAQAQSAAVERLNRQVRQLQAGLEAAVLSSQAASVDELLATIAGELMERFEMDAALVARWTPAGARLVHVTGSLPDRSRLEALFGQRNPLRQVLGEGRQLVLSDISRDDAWRDNSFLAALSAASMIALPLSIDRERRAAVLAVGRKATPEFHPEDQQVLAQVGRQLEVALQNMQLLTETRRRLQELDLLLAFTRQLGGQDPDGILHVLLDSVRQVVPSADAAWVALWDERQGHLAVRAASGYRDGDRLLGVTFEQPAGGAAPAPYRALHSGMALRLDEIHFAGDYRLASGPLMDYRTATGGALPVSGLLAPFSRGESVRGVLALENFQQAAAFASTEDQNLALSLCQQAALAMENARLFAAVEGRAAQLQALTSAAGAITSSLHSDDLLNTLLAHMRPVVPYDTATLWLRHESLLQVAAASGFPDNESRIGLSVAVEDSRMLQEMIATGAAVSVADIRGDARFTSLLEPEYLSWLGIPLISQSQVTGVIALESRAAGFYETEHIQAAAAFASQAAVALENAFLFEESLRRAAELDQRSRRLALLNHFSEGLGSSLDMEHVLRLTLQQAAGALSADYAAIVMPAGENTYQAWEVRPEGLYAEALPPGSLWEHLEESQGIFTARDITEESELQALQTFFAARQVRSMASAPLMAGANLHGWLWVCRVETYRFTSSELELARTIANQAALAIQNSGLYVEVQRLAYDLEQRVEERTIEYRREHQNTQTLLRIITELSASLELEQVLERTLAVLNESTGAEESLILMANPNAPGYAAGTRLARLHENGRSNEKLIASWITRSRTTALADDLSLDPRWELSADTLAYRSMIAVPLALGEEVLGTLLLVHSQPSRFVSEQVRLVEATARQISIALNNAELFNLIRDQSENMGAMLREQQVESSRMRAILEAVADGVVVTDENMRVTLFNASAQRILSMQAGDVVGKSMEQFAGLFGSAARFWLQTIRAWSEDPDSYGGQAYAEQINLDNDKVVSIHLAPVTWRSELLGTVSIFRDITHEVQVDRLKSEFVANVSHELRTPLTSIKGYVEIMLMGASGEISTQQRHFLEIVKSNTERLTVLLNDLLDISRIEAGRVSLLLQQLNLGELAEDVASDIRRRSQEENKPMQVRVTAPRSLPRVYGDFTRVRQVLGNLLTNAYNYTPAGGEVAVQMADCGGEVQVDVIDTGIGIPGREHERIFDRFFRGDDPLVLSTSGTGLGLALSKTLVEMHHGRIWFRSSGVPGEGSTFSFTLPVHRMEE